VGRRLLPVALLTLCLALVPSANAAFGEHVLGPQRVLVALVTWGPQPFVRDNVRHIVFDEVDQLYRDMSYGKTSLTGTVTPWLKAFDSAAIGCNLPNIKAQGSAAALAAGFDPSRYDRIVFIHPEQDCPWSGVTQAGTVFLNGAVTEYLVAHELGHSFGLGHANLTACKHHGCGALEYGDPYDTMGAGSGDFSAKAKFELGWLTSVARPGKNGMYTLAPIERASKTAQALVVTTANDQYWVEYRSRPADSGAGSGVLLRVSPSPDHDDGAIPDQLLGNPAGRGRPELLPGDRFTDPRAFSLTVLRAGSSARLRFRWTDRTAPKTPRFTATVVSGRLQVTVDGNPRETGSGLARYEVTLDRRTLSFGTNAAEEPVQVGRPLPGTHVVRVVAVDRAGNRSPAGIRQVRIS
jgi:hypothetical protein